MTILSLGLIGCGNIARSAHLPAIAELAGRVKLLATSDVELEAARAAARPWGATAYTDYRSVVERSDIDAVIVATPEFFHAEQVIAAAETGKHVLCEKPMCRSLTEADHMIEACRRAGVVLLIGHSRRFTRRYIEVKRALDAGAIGEVRLLRENERRNTTHLAHMRQQGIRWTPQHWTGNLNISSGVALSHGIHEVDLLRWFTGAQPVAAYAEHAVTIEGNEGVPDFMSFVVRFDSGALGSGEISYHPPASYPAFHQLELFGTAGAIRARDHELIGATEYDARGAHFPGAHELLLHNRSAYVRQLAEFVSAILENRNATMPPSEARAALAVALALLQSAQTGREVILEPNAPIGVIT